MRALAMAMISSTALNISVIMCVRYFMYHASLSSTNVAFDKLAY